MCIFRTLTTASVALSLTACTIGFPVLEPAPIGQGFDTTETPLPGEIFLPDTSTIIEGIQGQHHIGQTLASGDLDGDGTPELIVSDDGRGRLLVFDAPLPAGHLPVGDAIATIEFWGALSVGDLNGDGRDDIVVNSWGGTAAVVFLGPVQGERSVDDADLRILGPSGLDARQVELDARGDLNGDGQQDLALIVPQSNAAFVFSGPLTEDGSLDDADAAIQTARTFGDYGPTRLAGGGDLDGNGSDDLVLSAPAYPGTSSTKTPEAVLIFGGPLEGDLGPADAMAVLQVDEDHLSLGMAMDTAGDVDGDGREDLVLSVLEKTAADFEDPDFSTLLRVLVFQGPYDGFMTLRDADATVEDDQPAPYGAASLFTGADVNRDGADDLLGSPTEMRPSSSTVPSRVRSPPRMPTYGSTPRAASSVVSSVVSATASYSRMWLARTDEPTS